MKNFLKGFFLGFGLMLCFFIGIVATKAYEIFLVSEQNTYFNIRAQDLDLARAQSIAQEYSKALKTECSIADLDINMSYFEPIAYAAPTASQAAEDDENTGEAEASQTSDEQSAANISQQQILQPILPVKTARAMGFLRLKCKAL